MPTKKTEKKAAPKVVKPKAVKPVEEPVEAIESAPVAEPVNTPSGVSIELGKHYEHEGNVITFTSLKPVTAQKLSVVGGCQVTEDYPLESLEGVEPLDVQEAYARVF